MNADTTYDIKHDELLSETIHSIAVWAQSLQQLLLNAVCCSAMADRKGVLKRYVSGASARSVAQVTLRRRMLFTSWIGLHQLMVNSQRFW